MYLLFYGVDIKERVEFCTGGTSTSGVFGDYLSIVSILMAIGVIGKTHPSPEFQELFRTLHTNCYWRSSCF